MVKREPAETATDNEVVRSYQEALLDSTEPRATLVDDLNTLFTEHWESVYRVCFRFVGQEDVARELTQESMLRAFEKLHQFKGTAHFCTWLYSISRSICLQKLRRPGELLLEDGVIEGSDPEANILKKLQRHERERVLRDATTAVLDPLEQEAVYLRYVEQIPQERITQILEISQASGARGLLQRCRRKLRRELQNRLKDLGHGRSFILDSG